LKTHFTVGDNSSRHHHGPGPRRSGYGAGCQRPVPLLGCSPTPRLSGTGPPGGLPSEMGFQVTVAGTGDENKDQSDRPLGGIEQPERTRRLPPSVQDSTSLAVLASLPLNPCYSQSRFLLFFPNCIPNSCNCYSVVQDRYNWLPEPSILSPKISSKFFPKSIELHDFHRRCSSCHRESRALDLAR
jgi:hypothetical protein